MAIVKMYVLFRGCSEPWKSAVCVALHCLRKGVSTHQHTHMHKLLVQTWFCLKSVCVCVLNQVSVLSSFCSIYHTCHIVGCNVGHCSWRCVAAIKNVLLCVAAKWLQLPLPWGAAVFHGFLPILRCVGNNCSGVLMW